MQKHFALPACQKAGPGIKHSGQSMGGTPIIMNHFAKIILLAVCLNLVPAARTIAGPPFLTDDPEPVDYQHWEFYLFANGEPCQRRLRINGPAAELNYGVLPDTQLHLVVPALTISPDNGPSATGLGDTEFGIKISFRPRVGHMPQIGIFPDGKNCRPAIRTAAWAMAGPGSACRFGCKKVSGRGRPMAAAAWR